MGRPSKLTEAVVRDLVENIELGQTHKLACQAAGIHYGTFRQWMVRAEDDPSAPQEYRDFHDRITRAEAKGSKTRMALIGRHAIDDWKAAAWIQERRFPDEYGRQERMQVTGKDGGPIEVDSLTPEQRRERLAQLLAKRDKST